ncbi:MAG: Sec-independent protein translocase protein TatB [Alphaproteobacteria bacterium MarineAlpha5_Bin5]|nr:MAG: Sec-independent protein translocase protein TatB [Alphaproteobacteria bacterium MarineAlpha5_Bin5]PPR52082.1 MAG: Sec-independent protein translocase protein TatB [Alphaproteobacteria bacterium MarineAlpha5_Bin4]|tara:strand:+ start:2236 stop:2556 length:321 start_codon:yes stop_codon:yes gene_type:complete
MFTFGWGEIFLLIIVLVVVIGPKELPSFIKQIASFTKSIKKISREFKSSLNEIAKDDEFTDVKKTLSDVKNLKEDFNLKDNFKTEINSIKETSSLIKNDVDEINKK